MTPEETAVSAANLGFYRALEARDLAAMETVWLQEPTSTCVHPGWHRLDGWAEIRRSWENIFLNSRPWTVSCEDIRIGVVGDFACVTCVEVITPFGGDEEAIVEAMKLLMTRAKLFVEGAGAAATAALLDGGVKLDSGARVVAIVSGGNVDLERVARTVLAA